MTHRGWRQAAVALALMTLVVACGGSTSTTQKPSVKGLVKPGTLILATTGNFPPFTMTNTSTGKVEGFSADIGAELAKALGLKLETPAIDFNAEMQGLASGQYDIADSGIWPTPDRQKTFLFSIPVASTGFIATVPPKNKSLAGLSNIKGLKIGAVQGSAREQWALANKDKLGYQSYQGFPGQAQLIQALQQGRIDLIVDDPLVVYYYETQHPNDVTTAGDPILEHPLSLAIRLGNIDLQAALNKQLKAMISNGTLAKLMKKWWGRCIPLPDDMNQNPPYKNPTGC